MNVMSAVVIPMTSCDMYVCHDIMCDMYVMYLHSQLVETWSSGGVCIYICMEVELRMTKECTYV